MKPSQKISTHFIRIGNSTLTLKGIFDPEQMSQSSKLVAAHVEKIMADEKTGKQTWESISLIAAIEKMYEVLSMNREVADLKRQIERWENLFEETSRELSEIEVSAKKALVDSGRRR